MDSVGVFCCLCGLAGLGHLGWLCSCWGRTASGTCTPTTRRPATKGPASTLLDPVATTMLLPSSLLAPVIVWLHQAESPP